MFEFIIHECLKSGPKSLPNLRAEFQIRTGQELPRHIILLMLNSEYITIEEEMVSWIGEG